MAVIKVNNPKNIIDVVNKKAYFKLVNVGGLKGDKGDKGDTGTIMVGTTTTGQPGTNASVENVGTNTAAVLNFTIPRGDKGAKGDTGATGSAATVNVGSTSTGAPGTSASVTNSGTSSAAVLNFTIPRGAKGDTGTAATVAAGTTTTLPAGSSATVTNSGTSSAAVFNFGVPKGDKGDTGTAATVTVGSTTTGAAGTSASVTNSGTSSAAVLDFTIPKGDTGQVSSNYVNSLPSSGNEYSFYLVDRDIPEQTATGEYINFTNANNYGNFTSIELDGNTSQDGTPNPDYPQPVITTTGENVVQITGKNLFDKDNANLVHYFIGATAFADYANANTVYIPIVGGQTYTVSTTDRTLLESDASMAFTDAIVDNNHLSCLGNRVQWNSTLSSITATAPNNAKYLYVYVKWQSSGVSEALASLQIELGSTATTYEPYQAQEYEVNLGKNLLDVDLLDRTNNGITFDNDGNGGLEMSGTISSTYAISNAGSCNLPAGTYTVSIGETLTHAIGVATTDANNTRTTHAILSGNKSSTFTLTNTAIKYDVYISGLTANTNVNLDVKIQLEKGSTATDYAPYFTPIELLGLGERDEYGVAEYSDYIYKSGDDWYIHKETGKVVLDGSENWIMPSSGNYCRYDNADFKPSSSAGSVSLGYSDNYTAYSYNNIYDGVPDYGFAFATTSRIVIRNKDMASASDFQTWLSSNPTTVYYVLATATDTKITNSALINQLDAILSAYLYQGVNNVFTDTINEVPTIKITYLTYDQYNKCHVYIWNDTLGDWQVIVP